MASTSLKPTIADQTKVAADLKNFSVTLFQVISKQISVLKKKETSYTSFFIQAVGKNAGPSENIFISPFSVVAVLSMAGVGAKGETASQLKKSLGLANFTDETIHSVMGSLIQSIKVQNSHVLCCV